LRRRLWYRLHLVVTQRLDRELEDRYLVTVLAVDGGDPPKTGSVLVNTTDMVVVVVAVMMMVVVFGGSGVGDPPKTGSVLVNITVLDANDNNPQFDNSSYEVEIGPFHRFDIDTCIGIHSIRYDSDVSIHRTIETSAHH